MCSSDLYTQHKVELEHNQMIQERAHKIRSMCTGMKEQLDIAQHLLVSGEKIQMKNILDQSYESFKKVRLEQFCENDTVNSVLNVKKKLMEEKGESQYGS